MKWSLRLLYLISIVALLFCAFGAHYAWAQDAGVVASPPPNDLDFGMLMSQFFTAISTKNWFLLAGVVLTAVVYVVRKYVFTNSSGFFATKWGGWVLTLGLALVGGVITSLVAFGGGAFSLAALGTLLVGALKTFISSAIFYRFLHDAFGVDSKPAVA